VGGRKLLVARDLDMHGPICPFVERVVRRLETLLPGSFHAYYLLGSYADGTAVPASDIDLVAVLRPQEPYQEETLNVAKAACSDGIPVQLSLQVQSLGMLARSQRSLALLQRGSVLLLGEDYRAELPAVDVDGFTREAVSLARCFTTLGRTRNDRNAPFSQPNEEDEFYGRARVRIPSLYHSPAKEGTKELVKGLLWSVTSLLAVQCGAVVASARQAVEQYEKENGEWWRFVRDSTQLCKHAWNYQVPRDRRDRAELRSICRQLVDFENYCAAAYACWGAAH
jgi:hypothetical protein